MVDLSVKFPNMSSVDYILGSGAGENGSGDSKMLSLSGSRPNGSHIVGGSVNKTHNVMHGDLHDHEDIDDDSPENSPGCSSMPLDFQDGPPQKKQKKTKGRVKIKMEFIDNKLRRYTTFSKRKTGIMKKAYELSTLTGTQVMLLVASETGHVYTFATRKLQPMITSESGKALIQTCLNSPDLPGENVGRNPDQRMCATGFEETELTYSVTDDDEKEPQRNPMFTITNVPGAGADASSMGPHSSGMSLAGTGHTYPMTTYLPTQTTSSQSNGVKQNASIDSSHNRATGYTAFLSQGTSLTSSGPSPGITAAPISSGLVQVSQGLAQPVQLQQLSTQATTPTLVRLAQTGNPPPTSNQTDSTSRQPVLTTLLPSALKPSQQTSAVAMLTNAQTQGLTSSSGSTLTTPIMYQTPQGVVYAAATPATPGLAEGMIFNYQAAHQNNGQTSTNNAAQTFPITLSVPFQGIHLSQAQLPNGTLLGADPKKETATSQST